MSAIIPKEPDELVMSLLVKVKLFFEHAVYHAKIHTTFDRMIALHNLDNSVEYMLRVIIFHLDIENITGKNLDSCELAALFGEINSYLRQSGEKELPYFNEIRKIRQLRNLVQHGMADPGIELDLHIKIVERFFDRSLLRVFGMSINNIRMASLIKDQGIKKAIELAEKYILEGDYLKAIIECRNAFENAKLKKVVQDGLNINLMPALLEAKKQHSYLYHYLQNNYEDLQIQKLNIDSRLYQRFSDYVKHIPFEHKADKSGGHLIMQRDWEKDDALFCHSFVSGLVIMWEHTEMEPLYETKPFEHEYSWIEKLNNIEFKRINNYGCKYAMGDNSSIDYFFVDKETKYRIVQEIKEGMICKYVSEVYVDSTLSRIVIEDVEIIGLIITLATNNPEMWQVVIWMEMIPMTMHIMKMENNDLKNIYFDISGSENTNQLIELGLSSSIASEIFEPIKSNLGLSNFQYARHVHKCLQKAENAYSYNLYSKKLVDEIDNGFFTKNQTK